MRNKIPKNVAFISIAILVLACVITSCVDDRESYNDGKENAMLTFSIKLPAQQRTYALSVADENAVSDVNVLVFRYTEGQYQLCDWGQPSPTAINDDGASNKKKFIVGFTRLAYGNKYKFVILANAKQEVKALFDAGLDIGASKDDILSSLELSGVARWNMNVSDNNYRTIPMWGETPSQDGTGDITLSQNITIGGLNLLRMVARINVKIDEGGTPPATSVFKLKSVLLYNTYRSGRIVPEMVNLSPNSTTSVASPTLVEGSTLLKGPVVYDTTIPGCDITDTQLVNNIYTFESVVTYDNSGKPVPESLTCLVVGGLYAGRMTPTYYRIDLAKKDASGNITYPDILRNHTYDIKIVKVKGAGYATPEEAFKAKASNIESELIFWDDSQISDIVYDGQYMLGVSQEKFILSRDRQTINSLHNDLTITTNYPSGWKIDRIFDEMGNVAIDWLGVINPSGTVISAGPSMDVKLQLAENNTGAVRRAFIRLVAGRLTYRVEVIQGIDKELDLETRDINDTRDVSELIFTAPTGVQPEQQKFLLEWEPVTATVQVSNSTVGNNAGFVFAPGSDAPGTNMTSISAPSGKRILTIQPTPITPDDIVGDPFLERNYKIDFTVSNGESLLTKSVFLRQIHYNLLADGLSGYNPPDGRTYSFKVKSNTDWRIKSISEQITNGGTGTTLLNLQASDNLRVGTTGTNNTNPGTTITFRSINNMTLAGNITVVFESVDTPKKFEDVTLVLNLMNEYYPKPHLGWAGSNIYYDDVNKRLTFDDVNVTEHSKFQGVFFRWGSLYGISPQGVWSGSTTMYPPAGNQASASSLGYSVYENVPYLKNIKVESNPPSDKEKEDRAYLWEVTKGNTGDICKWLTQKGYAPSGKKWRMPTSKEFEEASSYSHTGTFGSKTSTNESGMFVLNMGYTKNDIGNPFFPAAGGRSTMGSLASPGGLGQSGRYWSATISVNYQDAMYLSFNNSSLNPSNMVPRANAFPVRCVVDDE